MDDVTAFDETNQANIKKMAGDAHLRRLGSAWFNAALAHRYPYHFKWLGLPIIQFPQDIVAAQELVWEVKPDLIIEAGIARGGSLILYASLMAMLGEGGLVVGVDVDIRDHNREAIEAHPLSRYITLIQGSSIDQETIGQVGIIAEGREKVMVVLDSHHTHDHVLRELQAYAPLVSKGSYILVFDTVIEDIPEELNDDRLWGKGNNPKTAVNEFLQHNQNFEVDHAVENKLLLTVCPNGFLKRVK